jgi:hypothetical protein
LFGGDVAGLFGLFQLTVSCSSPMPLIRRSESSATIPSVFDVAETLVERLGSLRSKDQRTKSAPIVTCPRFPGWPSSSMRMITSSRASAISGQFLMGRPSRGCARHAAPAKGRWCRRPRSRGPDRPAGACCASRPYANRSWVDNARANHPVSGMPGSRPRGLLMREGPLLWQTGKHLLVLSLTVLTQPIIRI